tara:strand:- start:1398 stop:2405 length:1008 start_codon:yes stop_codon:yes gene_type:complete
MGLLQSRNHYVDLGGKWRPEFPQEYNATVDEGRNFPVRVLGNALNLSTQTGKTLVTGSLSYISHPTFTSAILRLMFSAGNHTHSTNTSNNVNSYTQEFDGYFREGLISDNNIRVEMKDAGTNRITYNHEDMVITSRTIQKEAGSPIIKETVNFICNNESSVSTNAQSSKVADKGYAPFNGFDAQIDISPNENETSWSAGHTRSQIKAWTLTENTGFEYAEKPGTQFADNTVIQNLDNAGIEFSFTIDMTTDVTLWNFVKNNEVGSLRIWLKHDVSVGGVQLKQQYIYNRVRFISEDHGTTEENPTEQTILCKIEEPTSGDICNYVLVDLETDGGW